MCSKDGVSYLLYDATSKALRCTIRGALGGSRDVPIGREGPAV